MEGEIMTPGAPVEQPKKGKSWLIIVIVIVLLLLCCCIVPIVLWFTGDSILNMIGIDPNSVWQDFSAVVGALYI